MEKISSTFSHNPQAGKIAMATQGTPLDANFPSVLTLPVLWGNQDAFGHVNNVVYFRWFESARIEYWNHVGIDDLVEHEKIGPILAAINCNYRRQLNFPDTVHIGASVTRLGRTSVIMAHRVYSAAQQEVVADGESTIVLFDYNTHRPHRIPDHLREHIEAFEGKSLSGDQAPRKKSDE